MSNYDTQNVEVFNYNQNKIFVNSTREHYAFSASRDGVTPSVVSMPFSELQSINSNTDIIITGWLTFDEKYREEIMKDLRIPNYKDILTNEEIVDILTHPTMEGLQKIIDINTSTYFDRVRIIMFKLTQDGIDVTTKVSRIVEQRYDELRNKQRISSIVLTKKDTQKYATPEEVKDLTAQNAALKAQMDEMKKMMEQMMKSQLSDKETEATEVTEVEESPKATTKTTTRKRTTKTKQTT